MIVASWSTVAIRCGCSCFSYSLAIHRGDTPATPALDPAASPCAPHRQSHNAAALFDACGFSLEIIEALVDQLGKPWALDLQVVRQHYRLVDLGREQTLAHRFSEGGIALPQEMAFARDGLDQPLAFQLRVGFGDGGNNPGHTAGLKGLSSHFGNPKGTIAPEAIHPYLPTGCGVALDLFAGRPIGRWGRAAAVVLVYKFPFPNSN